MVWHHTFHDQLKCSPEEAFGVFLTDSHLNPKANRAKLATIMFETFKVKRLYVANEAAMSLYASGRTTGLVCDSGYGITKSISVVEGQLIIDAAQEMEISGRSLTNYLEKLLVETSN